MSRDIEQDLKRIERGKRPRMRIESCPEERLERVLSGWLLITVYLMGVSLTVEIEILRRVLFEEGSCPDRKSVV